MDLYNYNSIYLYNYIGTGTYNIVDMFVMFHIIIRLCVN